MCIAKNCKKIPLSCTLGPPFYPAHRRHVERREGREGVRSPDFGPTLTARPPDFWPPDITSPSCWPDPTSNSKIKNPDFPLTKKITRLNFQLSANWNVSWALHRRLRSHYLTSHQWKNYPSASEGFFGFSWIMLSNDAKIRACFPSFLAATAPRSEAVSSTLKLVGASNSKGTISYFVPYEGLKWF